MRRGSRGTERGPEVMRQRSLWALLGAGFAFAACGGNAAFPAETDPEGATPCDISAWTRDADGEGVPVHDGPSADSAIIARLPSPIDVADYAFAPEVSITASRDGWFRIDGAELINYVWTDKSETVFSGTGWVAGARLGLGLNDGELHEGPSAGSPVVAVIAGVTDGVAYGPDSVTVERLHACRGGWVDVEGTTPDDEPVRGWSVGTCSNQVTTCP